MAFVSVPGAPICSNCIEDFYQTCPCCGDSYLPRGAGARMLWDDETEQWVCTYCNDTLEFIREGE